MIKRFYVDINALNEYSKFLNMSMSNANSHLIAISKAHNNLQAVMQDDITRQVSERIGKQKKIFANFTVEVDTMSKNVKQDFELYQAYSKKLK